MIAGVPERFAIEAEVEERIDNFGLWDLPPREVFGLLYDPVMAGSKSSFLSRGSSAQRVLPLSYRLSWYELP